MQRGRFGELSIFLACIFFAGASVAVKGLAGDFSGPFVSWVRFALGGLGAVVLMRFVDKGLRIRDRRVWLLRGLFGALAMSLAYLGIQLTSSGRAVLLANTYPLFVALYGALFFREHVTRHNLIALLLCFAGVLLVFGDRSHYSWVGNLAALLSGVTGGFAVHFMKQARERNSPFSVYLSACLFGLVVNAFALPEAGRVGSSGALALALVALLALIGQVLATYGYRYVTATRGAVIGFAETLLTIVFSFVLLGEEMKPMFFAGMGLILLGLGVNQNLLRWPRREGKARTT